MSLPSPRPIQPRSLLCHAEALVPRLPPGQLEYCLQGGAGGFLRIAGLLESLSPLADAEAHRLEDSTPDVVINDHDALDEIGRVHRLYAVLSRVNEAIIRVRSRQELLAAACRIAVEDGGFALAWIGFVVPETQLIRVHAKYGRDDGYLDNIEISLRDDVPEGRGPRA